MTTLSATLTIETFKAEGDGCLGYLLVDEPSRTALAIDPRLDLVDRFQEALVAHAARLTHVLDTHTHADHLSGVRQLAQRTGAIVLAHVVSKLTGPSQRIKDGAIGDLTTMRAYRLAGRTAKESTPRQPADEPSELLWQIKWFHSFLWLSGGAFSDFLIHNVDECCWMKDAWPVRARATGGRHYRGDNVDQNFDHYAVEYTFADGSKLFLDGRTIDGPHLDGAQPVVAACDRQPQRRQAGGQLVAEAIGREMLEDAAAGGCFFVPPAERDAVGRNGAWPVAAWRQQYVFAADESPAAFLEIERRIGGDLQHQRFAARRQQHQ